MSLFVDVLPEDEQPRISKPSFEVIADVLPRLSSAQFAGVWAVLVGCGIALWIFVHLLVSQGEYVESSLRTELRLTKERVHVLQTTLLDYTSITSLRDKGRQYNMSPAVNAVGINLSTGEVLGMPQAAPAARFDGATSSADSSSGAWKTDDTAVLVPRG